mmetsp:Transcript_5779/g.20139  ORF Transcript_5779/g.20139 Transcript_5779/m.20139 type:complete len:366 (-) Transcript_5779:412-1509(-)
MAGVVRVLRPRPSRGAVERRPEPAAPQHPQGAVPRSRAGPAQGLARLRAVGIPAGHEGGYAPAAAAAVPRHVRPQRVVAPNRPLRVVDPLRVAAQRGHEAPAPREERHGGPLGVDRHGARLRPQRPRIRQTVEPLLLGAPGPRARVAAPEGEVVAVRQPREQPAATVAVPRLPLAHLLVARHLLPTRPPANRGTVACLAEAHASPLRPLDPGQGVLRPLRLRLSTRRLALERRQCVRVHVLVPEVRHERQRQDHAHGGVLHPQRDQVGVVLEGAEPQRPLPPPLREGRARLHPGTLPGARQGRVPALDGAHHPVAVALTEPRHLRRHDLVARGVHRGQAVPGGVAPAHRPELGAQQLAHHREVFV